MERYELTETSLTAIKTMDHENYRGVFDLSDADGVNESERLLYRLCRRSFLSLWAHANLHTDQDMRAGKGSAKEFADVLVVFGDDVIIFSDKHVAFQRDRDVATAWSRWYKRAVADSSRQLHGAMGWIRRFPNRVFLDSKCTRPLPIQIPPPDRARYYLVAITRGSFEACAAHFPGSLGTHQIRTDLEGKTHENALFTIGVLDRSKPFIHVFDEYSLEVLMEEMDTITDFVRYLRAREEFLLDDRTLVVATGEEQLIASYILNSSNERKAFLPEYEEGKPDFVMLDESHYPALKTRTEYLQMRKDNARSKIWDEMVERFIRLGDPTIVLPDYVQPNDETEQALRIMAAEPRFRRVVLIEALTDLLRNASAAPTGRRARVWTTHQDPHLVYIFLVLPQRENESYDEYRLHRASVLHAYVRCAKLKLPAGETFIGIGLDHPSRVHRGGSEDLIVFNCNDFTDEGRAEAERMRHELGILPDDMPVQHDSRRQFARLSGSHGWAAPREDREHTAHSRSGEEQARAKRKAKARVANASRKRNARK